MAALSPGEPEEAFTPPYVPAPARPLPLPQFFATFVRNPIRALPAAVYRDWIVTYRTPRSSIAWITGPSLIKTVLLDERETFPKTPLERKVLGPLLGDGLLTADGPAWRWQRQIVAPLFRHADLLGYVPAMAAAAGATVETWRRAGAGPRRIDRDMTRATYRVITDTILAGSGEAVAERIERAHDDYLQPITWQVAFAVLGLPGWLPHPGRARMRRSALAVRQAVGELVRRRKAEASGPDDLLARLIAARDPETGAAMAEALLVDNIVTFLSAGHATTAMALTWSLYLLSRSPAWQERLRREVHEVAGSGPVTAAHVAGLVLTQQVVKEAMRLYPPAPVMTRIAGQEVRLGGERLPKDTLVVIPISAVHRHERLWQAPASFAPGRFSAEAEAARPRYQYLPFGAGPRICIGQSFAQIEAAVLLASFLGSARFAADPAAGEPEPISRVTLRPRGGLGLIVTPLA